MTRKPTVTAADAKPAAAKKPAAAPKSAAKAPAAKAAAAKPAAAAAKPARARPAKAGQRKSQGGAADRPVLKLKELVDRVVERAGAKKKDAKPVVEAMLAILGDALAAGESLILPPLGRVRVNRTKEAANGAMLTIKLKRGGGVKKSTGNGDDDLAEPPE